MDGAGNRGACSEYVSATVPGSPAVPVANEQRAALVALYHATGGAGWTQNDNWLSRQPLADWHGVVTDAKGHVTELRLANTGLSGPVPDLSALTSLTTTVP